MASAVRHNIPLVNIVFNNNAFGHVKLIQQEWYGGRTIASDLTNPDFVRYAQSFGAEARHESAVRLDLRRRQSRRERPWPRGDGSGVCPQHDRLPAIDREFEPRLMAADELDIDGGEKPAIQQRAVLVALRQIDAVALAQGIETARGAGMPPSRKCERVDNAVPTQEWPGGAIELGIEKAEIEGRVVHHEPGAIEEGEHIVGKLGKARLVAQEFRGEAMHVEGLIGHVAFGVQMTVPHPPRRDAVDQLDTADLDDPVAVERVEPRGLGVEDDFAQSLSR
jgi:hypothetical protein